MELVHGLRPERDCAYEHDKETDACAPQVCLEPSVSSAFYDFRGDVCGCPALIVHAFCLG